MLYIWLDVFLIYFWLDIFACVLHNVHLNKTATRILRLNRNIDLLLYCTIAIRYIIIHWPIEAWNLNKRKSIGGISEWTILNENACILIQISLRPWWRHQMETFSALLVLCERNPPVTGVFPSQRPVTRSFGVFFDVRMNNGWANNWDVDDLRRHRTHYDVTVILFLPPIDHKSALIQVMAWCHLMMQRWSWLLTIMC